MRKLRLLTSALSAAVLVWSAPAASDPSLEATEKALSSLPDQGRRFAERGLGARPSDRFYKVLSRYPSRAEALLGGAVPITDRIAVDWIPRERPESSPGRQSFWAPPRALLLDKAGDAIRLPVARENTGLSGQGVIVGVIDTGADLSHPSLRHADGRTRVRYLLSFGESARGFYPELESAYGCNLEPGCAIFGAEEIDEGLSMGGETLPSDPVGHGTHVLSTAAGRDDDYPGVAPEADLIVVQSGGTTGAIGDADILIGASFIFDRASELGQPAVINVSLGSSFGGHDGSSTLEQALAELASGPGRAIVVASGNDGALYGGDLPYPEPFGIHTEVAVSQGAEVEVPLVIPLLGDVQLEGAVYAWISGAKDLRIWLEGEDGNRSAGAVRGDAIGQISRDFGERDEYDLVLLHGVDEGQDVEVPSGNAVVALVGRLNPNRPKKIVLTGEGSARIWLQSSGELGPATTGTGVLLSRARTSGTVGIPASHPDLIAVGASTNRSSFTDYTGARVEFERDVGELAFFSSAGPNQLGFSKPDLVAPGEFVIASMSSAADPRDALLTFSQFQSGGLCESSEVECLVVDDFHALSSGTSMASPVVAGTVALLFQRDPELTMKQARAFLRAGATAVPGLTAFGAWVGAGELDIPNSLLAQDLNERSQTVEPEAKNSRLSLSDTFARPRGKLYASLLLRDHEGGPASIDLSDLQLDVLGGSAKVLENQVGEVAFVVSVDALGIQETLQISAEYRGESLTTEEIPIGVDPMVARIGYYPTGGTCEMARSRETSALWLPWVWILGMVYRHRRSKSQGS